MTKEEDIIKPEGLTKIKHAIDFQEFPKEMKLLGTKITNPKKLLLSYYTQIIEGEQSITLLNAKYKHCCDIVMSLNGKTDTAINAFWWSKNKEKK